MKKITIILLTLLSISCNHSSNSTFFNDCSTEEIDLRQGILLTDSLNHFSITIPNTASWKPIFNYDTNGTDFVVCDTSTGYLRCFGITELKKQKTWSSDWKVHQKEIDSIFNVQETGTIYIDNNLHHWSLVKFEESDYKYYSLFITVEHPSQDIFYTLNISVDGGRNVKSRICQMRSFIDYFKIIKGE